MDAHTARRQVAIPAGQRHQWMDVLRGAAIVLVVLWHASAVPALYGATVPAPLLALDFFFLPFRMPALMLLSGVLLGASLRKPLARYATGKVQFVVWPYLVWVVLDRFVSGAEHAWFHWRSYYATSYLWYLFFIGVLYAVAPLLRKVPTPLVIAACALANLVLPSGTEDRLAYFAAFFFLGHLLGQRPLLLDRATRSPWVWPLAAAGVGVGVLFAVTEREHAYQVVLAPLSVAGVVASIAAVRWWERRGGGTATLSAMGRHSIVFYVSHFPVMVAGVWALRALGVEDVLVMTVVNTAAALAVGTLLVRLRDHRPVRWLFESPRTPTRALERWLAAGLDRLPRPSTTPPAPRRSPEDAAAVRDSARR